MDEKFCDYFDRWVKEFKEGNIREVTLDKYYCTSKALRKIAPALMMKDRIKIFRGAGAYAKGF
jgi:gp43